MTKPVCNSLQNAAAISLVIHERPDGDAIGSAAALYHYFNRTKKVEIVSVSPLPALFQKITGELPTVKAPSTKLIVLLDCAQLHRTGLEKELLAARKSGTQLVSFDHHKKYNLKRYVDDFVHDPEASSTAEVLFECFKHFRHAISPLVAQSLLLGIFTDTGCFRHANTTSQTLRAASRLIRLGADLGRLQTTFDNHRTIGKTKLWGRALSDVRLDQSGLAIVVVTAKLLADSAADENDVAGLANTLALLEEARAGAVLVETPKGWRATLRTRHSDVDLRRLAKFFEGRGMQKATGFLATNKVISGKIDSV